MPTKSVFLVKEYKEQRQKLQSQLINNKFIEIMDAIVEDYQAHVNMNLNLERVVHETVKADERARNK